MASYRIVVLPGSGLVTASVEKGGNLFPCPILISNPGLRLNYFRFQKKRMAAILEFYFRFRV